MDGQGTARIVELTRRTKETSIELRLGLDGTGESTIRTGIGYFDHMLGALAKHAAFDLTLTCDGDLVIDQHHTVEDCGIVLGKAIDQALGDRAGISRAGHAYYPLDEALARAVVDLGGRPWPEVDLGLTREKLGELATENLDHVLRSLAIAGRMALHVHLLSGANDHHRAEAAFKSLGLALREAVRIDTARSSTEISNSTKGVL